MPRGIYKRTAEMKTGKQKPNKEWKAKIKLSMKGKQNKLGVKTTEITKEKIRMSMSGEKCYNWQGGISYCPYSEDWTETLRESIRQRDSYMCQECGTHQDELTGRHKKLHIHHIDYDKENCDPKNLISLCQKCHMKTNYNREYWYNYFINSQNVKV
jgi:hypothetical protein